MSSRIDVDLPVDGRPAKGFAPLAGREGFEPAVRRLLASRQEQGLPPTVTDPVALSHIAAILRAAGADRATAGHDGGGLRRKGAA